MRLAQGITIDKEKTFGQLKFSALRREVFLQNEDGTVSTEVKERTYDLKSKEQGRMIPVSLTWFMSQKTFDGKKPYRFIQTTITYLFRPKVTYAGKTVKFEKEWMNQDTTIVRSELIELSN